MLLFSFVSYWKKVSAKGIHVAEWNSGTSLTLVKAAATMLSKACTKCPDGNVITKNTPNHIRALDIFILEIHFVDISYVV